MNANIDETIRVIFNDWDELSTKHSLHGAADTEPDWQFQNQIRRAYHRLPFVNLNRGQWEVFSGTPDSVVVELNQFTRKACAAIRKLGRAKSNRDTLATALASNVWRVCIDEAPAQPQRKRQLCKCCGRPL